MIAEPPVPTLLIACATCRKERKCKVTKTGLPRTPPDYKHHGEEYFCSDCWRKQWVLRAITIPAAKPAEGEWEDLRKALRAMWIGTTAASNWMMTELYARDVRRDSSKEKMPPMVPVSLYQEVRARFPGLPSQSVAALEHSVQRKYRAIRYNVVWTSSASLPNHRYPTPFPVPSQGWHATLEDGKPIVSLRIGDARWNIQLKRGPQFRRQMIAFRQIAKGEAVPGEMAVMDRDGVMVKLVAYLPRRQDDSKRADQLVVTTAKDCLLVALDAKEEKLWTYNGDHLRRWAAEHRAMLQRLADDQKYEQRPVPAFAQRREAAARKYRDRMDSATHEIAAQLATYAWRRHFASVRYDDSVHAFVGDGFPWYRLRNLIAEKLDARGIALEIASAAPVQEKPGPLAEE
jgi:hypothetical protein